MYCVQCESDWKNHFNEKSYFFNFFIQKDRVANELYLIPKYAVDFIVHFLGVHEFFQPVTFTVFVKFSHNSQGF